MKTGVPILQVENIIKVFPSIRAVDGVSFSIDTGTCFGLLGPNGAGKTTTLEIIEGVAKPTSGNILYKGEKIGRRFQQEAGFLFQTTALQEFLTVIETLKLFRQLYDHVSPLDELIETCSLEPLLKSDTRKLSGGQRQRVLLAIALINDPEIVFLDEPTTGMDPQARQNFWELIKRIKQKNKTIILTTHYMEEAEQLCDIISIMDQGKIITQDKPERLLSKHFDDVLLQIPIENFPSGLKRLQEEHEIRTGMVLIHTRNVHQTILNLNELDVDLTQLIVRNRNLEDLFLKLTGKELRA